MSQQVRFHRLVPRGLAAFPSRWPACLASVLALALACCGPDRGAGSGRASPATSASFAAQVEQFPRGIVQVADGVHVAVGFGLGNSVMIEGDGGLILVDTLESVEAATPVREAFRAINPAPVAAIVYTHNHADHVFGAGVFAGDDRPEVIAHANFLTEFDRLVSVTRPVAQARATRQFGTLLPPSERVHCGVGPRLFQDATTAIAPLLPTRTFEGGRLELDVAGVRLELLHAPGETPDQVVVWLPERKILLAGDNYYHAFPNLYAIRGSAYRDVLQWVESLDAMRALGAEVLVPGHTLPVVGAAEVHRRLTDYRDAIQFVHDQTVRAMNRGLSPDETVAAVRLPQSLASRPWLAEHYGRVDWSVRGIYQGYLGWFGGDAAELSPLPAGLRAARMADLAGGAVKLRDAARAALDRGDARWALELAGHLQALGEFTEAAARVRAAALRELAAGETSANGRNWALTQALEAEERIEVAPPDPSRVPADLLAGLPIASFLRAMTVRLDPRKAEGKTVSVGFVFPDTGEQWGMEVRSGIVDLQPRLPSDPDMTVTADSQVWKEVLVRRRNATAAFVSGDVRVDRSRLELVRFLWLFR